MGYNWCPESVLSAALCFHSALSATLWFQRHAAAPNATLKTNGFLGTSGQFMVPQVANLWVQSHFFFFFLVVVVVVAVGMIVTRFLSDSNATRRPCANLSGSVFHDQRSARSNGVRRPKQTARPTLLGLKRIGGHSGSLKMWLCPQNKAKLALSNLCCFNGPSHYQRAPSGHTK